MSGNMECDACASITEVPFATHMISKGVTSDRMAVVGYGKDRPPRPATLMRPGSRTATRSRS
jgi:hypothetical protein